MSLTLELIPPNVTAIEELRSTKRFTDMSITTDEDEHSIEMHLPYVRKVFEGLDIKVVPILVGAINKDKEASFGQLLAPYLARDDTFCVVSSDFCHWYATHTSQAVLQSCLGMVR